MAPNSARRASPSAFITLAGVVLMGPSLAAVVLRAPHGWKLAAVAAFMQVYGFLSAIQPAPQRPPPRLTHPLDLEHTRS